MRKNIIPDVVSGQQLAALPPEASVQDAARLMGERGVSSVLIMQRDRLLGIFTVRDVTRRVVATGLDPEHTPLAGVMTADPETVAPDELPIRALRCMHESGFRHLPVVQDQRVVGIVSRRDFFGEDEALVERETYFWEHIR